MAKHIIFLVHGMGRYGKVGDDGAYVPDHEWFNDAVNSLRETHDRYIKSEADGREAFDKRFKVIEIEFDSIFERFLVAWRKQSDTWTKLNIDGGVGKAVETAFASNKDNAFLWTHFADVALYTAPTVREQVKVKLASEIENALSAELADSNLDGWSVIAHSLGTAVAHDVLTDLQRHVAGTPISGTFWPPNVVCMIANVARILTDDVGLLYGDSLAPTGSHFPDAYVSCNHALDPFTRIAPFKPSADPWTRTDIGYADLSGLRGYYLLKEVIDWVKDPQDFDLFAAAVPHGFSHYMRQPEVIASLWPFLRGDTPADYPHLEAAVRAADAKEIADAVKARLATVEAGVRAKLEAALNKALAGGVAAGVTGRMQQLLRVVGDLA